jgi:hypothetical protein
MAMTIVEVISTVVPSETHFVVTNTQDGNFRYNGVLSYWLIAKVTSVEDGPVSIMSIPLVDGGNEIIDMEQKLDKCVFHWAEFRSNMQDIVFFGDEERNNVKNLLHKLWGESGYGCSKQLRQS